MDANFVNLNNNVLDVIMVANTVTLTSQAASEQELANLVGYSQILVSTANRYNRIRLAARVTTLSASVNTPRLYPQYSLDGTTYTTIGTGSGTNVLSLAATAFVVTDWITLPGAAQAAAVYFRIAQNGGNASASPVVRGVCYQFGAA
jgi:hypothetical protein